MSEFVNKDLSNSRFEGVDLSSAHFHNASLRKAHLHTVDLRGVTIRNAYIVDAEISGQIENLRVNGVSVMPLVEAELNRLFPDREKVRRPANADGFREAWDIVEGLWQRTVARARRLPSELLHERVEGEWSFIETLRHLLFATDAWVKRVILEEPSPWSPLDLPHDEMPDTPSIPRDRRARPNLEEVLELRADRMGTVRGVLAGLTEDDLARTTKPVTDPGYPEPESFPVRECLEIVLDEEWAHRLYAERDLDVLEARSEG